VTTRVTGGAPTPQVLHDFVSYLLPSSEREEGGEVLRGGKPTVQLTYLSTTVDIIIIDTNDD